jgi:hypothetical protein
MGGNTVTYGDAYHAPERVLSTIERKPNKKGCRIWRRQRDANGYGRITLNGQRRGVHRLVLERRLGRPIRPGFYALHICDNPSCCESRHLCEGTPLDNYLDAVERNPFTRACASKWIEVGRTAREACEVRDALARPILEAMRGQSCRLIAKALDVRGIRPVQRHQVEIFGCFLHGKAPWADVGALETSGMEDISLRTMWQGGNDS